VAEESTTPDPLELARHIREATNRRDFDAVMRFYAPDAVVRNTEIGTFEGRAAIRGMFEDVIGPFEEVGD
jgi:ketosteroid isomerase-like protein